MPNVTLNFLPEGKLITQYGNVTEDAKNIKSEAAAAIQTYHQVHGVLASIGDTLEIPAVPKMVFPNLIFRIVKRHITAQGIRFEIDAE